MPPFRRTTNPILAAVVLAALILVPATNDAMASESGDPAGATGHLEQTTPLSGGVNDLTPLGLPPVDSSWLPIGLRGGPVYELAISLGTEGGQRVVAAGNEVFVSDRASAWSLTRDRTGPVVNIAAGSDGAFYAAAANGVGYRSSNYGRNWYETRLRGDAPTHFLAVSPDYQTDKLAFGITKEDWRLYRADRGGTTWNELIIEPDAEPRYEFAALAFSSHFAVDETFFVGSDRGVFKTTDTGLNWSLKSGPDDGAPTFGADGGPASSQGIVIPFEYGDDPDRQFDPISETLFAYNADGVYRTDDDGVSWRRLALDVGQVNGLAVSNGWPDDPILLAAVSDPSGTVGAVSTDDGATWEMVRGSDGLTGTSASMAFDFAYIAPEIDPDTSIVYLPIGLRDWVLGEYQPSYPVSKPTGSREMYLSTDGGGVWRSRDLGDSWNVQSSGLLNAQVTALGYLPGGPNADVLAGTGAAGLYRSGNGGRTWYWQDVGLPRGDEARIYKLRVSPDFERDSTVFMANDKGVWMSRDGGRSWTTPAATSPSPAKTLDVSPSYGSDRTLVSAGKMSTDGGATWADLPVDIDWSAVAFSATYESDNTIWAGTLLPPEGSGNTLFRSDDEGQTWAVQDESLLRNRDILDLNVLSVVTVEPNRVFVATSRGLIVSHVNGGDWDRVREMSRIAGAVTSRTIFEPGIGQTGIVLASGQDGAAWSTDRGVSWVKEPAAPKNGTVASISYDGSVLLSAVPAAVARYGVGSAWIFLPVSHNGY